MLHFPDERILKTTTDDRDVPITYLADVIMTAKSFSLRISFIFRTAAPYLSIYPTLTGTPLLASNLPTSVTVLTGPADTGFSTSSPASGNPAINWHSTSDPEAESVVPLNAGGQPTKIACG